MGQTSNLHDQLDNDQIHVAKGFAASPKGGMPWRDEMDEQTFSSRLMLPPILARAASNVAAPTENDGDIYMLRGTRGPLTISSIAWQSANTVRYSFSGSPNLSTYTAGDYIYFKETDDSVNSGDFVITAVNDGSDWIEVSNLSVIDNTYDQAGAGGTGASTSSHWDGCRQQSWVKYNAALDKWYGIPLIAGNVMYDTTLKMFWLYDGETMLQLITIGEWTTPTFAAGDYYPDTGTFVVASGDVQTNRYVVSGKTLTWNVSIISATTTGTPTQLYFTIPNAMQARNIQYFRDVSVTIGATIYTDIFARVTSSGYLIVERDAAAAFANGSNNVAVSFNVTFETT